MRSKSLGATAMGGRNAREGGIDDTMSLISLSFGLKIWYMYRVEQAQASSVSL